MDDVMRKARELLAAEYEADGNGLLAHVLRDSEVPESMFSADMKRTLRAIAAALQSAPAPQAGEVTEAMTENEIRALVHKKAAGHATRKGSSGVTAWAVSNGIAKSHLSEFMAGKRAPTTDILQALRLEWRIVRKRAARVGRSEGGE